MDLMPQQKKRCYVKQLVKVEFKDNIFMLNPFSTNVPLMDKPCNWFLLAKCLKKPVDE